MHRKARKIHKQERSTELLDLVLKVKTRTMGEYKVPPPRRRYRMIRAISPPKDAKLWKIIDISQSLLLPEESDLCNDFISKGPDYFGRFCIHFPQHCVFGHILLCSHLLDNVDSWKEVVQPIKKPRSVGLHKSKPKKTTSKKKTNQKNKKSRSVIVLIPKKTRSVKIQTPVPEELRSGEDA